MITFRGKSKGTSDNMKDKLTGIFDNIDNSQISIKFVFLLNMLLPH